MVLKWGVQIQLSLRLFTHTLSRLWGGGYIYLPRSDWNTVSHDSSRTLTTRDKGGAGRLGVLPSEIQYIMIQEKRLVNTERTANTWHGHRLPSLVKVWITGTAWPAWFLSWLHSHGPIGCFESLYYNNVKTLKYNSHVLTSWKSYGSFISVSYFMAHQLQLVLAPYYFKGKNVLQNVGHCRRTNVEKILLKLVIKYMKYAWRKAFLLYCLEPRRNIFQHNFKHLMKWQWKNNFMGPWSSDLCTLFKTVVQKETVSV